jgi:hypothetical protein
VQVSLPTGFAPGICTYLANELMPYADFFAAEVGKQSRRVTATTASARRRE